MRCPPAYKKVRTGVGGEEYAADQSEHEKKSAEKDTNGDKILYRKTFFLNGLHD